jgi:hypothetical protein
VAEGTTVGEAVVLASERPEPGKETPGEGGEFDVSDFGVGRHALRLEVRLPGQEPYEVEGRFKVPKEIQFGKRAPFLLRPLMKRSPIPVGITLPVSVDPAKPDDVTIDWDGFLATGGRDEMKRGNEVAGVQRLRQQYPEGTARMREVATAELPTLIAGVRAGTIKRKDFDQSLETYVRNGYLEPEEADAARRELDGE